MSFVYSRHPLLQQAYHQALEFLRTTGLLVLSGPSGCGKSYLVSLLHKHGDRGTDPLLFHDLVSLGASGFESQLFGHVKGAFSDANRANPGLVGAAGAGILCLEGLEDLPQDGQARLLRFVQEGRYRALGATLERQFEGCLIFTSRFSLDELRRQKLLRDDFYFRLSGSEVCLPPLTERPNDLLALSQALAGDIQANLAIETKVPQKEELLAVSLKDLKGNLHGLRNLLQQAMIRGLAPGSLQQPQAGSRFTSNRLPDTGSLKQDLHVLEHQLLERALRQVEGSREDLAAALGISRRTLMYKLKEHGL